MAFLNDLGKKIGTAAGAAADKAKEVAEVTKLNSRINSEEKQIEKLYNEIGKAIFNLQKDDPDSPVAELCTQILASQKNIEELKLQIDYVKNPKE